MNNFFVTATGTDVGKTFVTAHLIRALATREIRATAYKPIVSGFDDDDQSQWPASDPGVLLSAMEHPVDRIRLDAISPFRYPAPLSADMASAQCGRPLDFATLVAATHQRLAVDPLREDAPVREGQSPGPIFIEGVGGVLVPLDDTRTIADFAATLDLPAVVVTRGALGTLSHTLTAVESLVRRDVLVAAVVLNVGVDAPDQRLGAANAPTVDATVRSLARHLAVITPVPPTIVVVRDGAPVEDFLHLGETLGIL